MPGSFRLTSASTVAPTNATMSKLPRWSEDGWLTKILCQRQECGVSPRMQPRF